MKALRRVALATAVVTAVALAPGVIFGTTSASAAIPANALMTGTIADNSTPISGATVYTLIWPNGDQMATYNAGDTIPTVVSTTTTAADGTFAVAPNLTNLGANYVGPSGEVDIEVIADGAPTNFTGAVPGSSFASDADAVTPASAGTMNVNTASATESTTIDGSRFSNAFNPDSTNQPDPGGPCSTTETKKLHAKNEKWLDLYTLGSSFADTTVTESVDTTHAIGVEFKPSGGSWSAEGSTDIENHNGSSLTRTYTGDNAVYNQVNGGEYETIGACAPGGLASTKVSSMYDVQTSASSIIPPTYSTCRTARKGDDFKKDEGSNLTFSGGVDWGFVSASAHAEFSHDTEVDWNVKAASQMCGDGNSWLQASNAALLPPSSSGCGTIAVVKASDTIKPDHVC